MSKNLFTLIGCAFLLSACAPNQVIWQSDNIQVELDNDPSLRKVLHNDQVLYYKVQDGYAYLDEHVVLGPVDEDGVLLDYLQPMGSSRSDCIFWLFCKNYRWPKGVVPYRIHKNLSAWQKEQVDRAIASIHSKTRIRLVPRESHHRDFVEFLPGRNENACVSYLGRRGGKQVIQLAANNCSAASVEHEIGHALGLLHEHQRCDRNQNVKIHWGQMKPQYLFNFINLCFMGEDRGEYDVTSNMHYSPYAFSRTGKPTITLVSGGLPTPSAYFSAGDLRAIEEIYADEFAKR